MLLGNNLWSLKAANMADLALLVFHFAECPSSILSIYPSSLGLYLNFSLPPTFVLTLHPFLLLSSSCLSPLHPPPPCCFYYASKLSLPFHPSLPACFSSLDLFQCLLIFSAHFCFNRHHSSVGDRRGMTKEVADWIQTCSAAVLSRPPRIPIQSPPL